jgi:hypothetical protein
MDLRPKKRKRSVGLGWHISSQHISIRWHLRRLHQTIYDRHS